MAQKDHDNLEEYIQCFQYNIQRSKIKLENNNS